MAQALQVDPTFESRMRTFGIDERTIDLDVQETIVPPPRSANTGEREAVAGLPLIVEREEEGEFRVLRTIGEGGMGIVRAAEQLSLRREVAVKSLRPQVRSPKKAAELLREAWVTGRLEHPNIIPVYSLGQDDEGDPVLVMKRVEGTSWRTILHTPNHPLIRGDALLFHLDVLREVCNAISFAHARGILHRDLKPENVMVGEFGEIYVVDWGIAVSTDPDEERIPRAAEIETVAGTPAYMAPEMVKPLECTLEERTDLYLLGATLHEVLTGQPPHEGNTMLEVLFSAHEAHPPAFGPEVPRELGELCARAMAKEPADRFESVRVFKEAVEAFIEHRASLQLSEDATARLDAIDALLADPDRLDEEHILDLYNRFGEVRFAFQEALRSWPENDEAAAGLDRALEGMARYEIHHGAYKAAAVLVAEMRKPPDDLRRELSALAGRIKNREAEVAQMAHDADVTVGQTQRFFMMMAMAVVWAALPIATIFIGADHLEQRSHMGSLLIAALYGLSVLAATMVWRNTLLGNAVNRKLMGALYFVFIGLLAIHVPAVVLESPMETIISMELLLFFSVASVVTATVDARVWPGAVMYLIAFVGATISPDYGLYWVAFGNLMGCATVGWAWRPSDHPVVPQSLIDHIQRKRDKIRARRERIQSKLGMNCGSADAPEPIEGTRS